MKDTTAVFKKLIELQHTLAGGKELSLSSVENALEQLGETCGIDRLTAFKLNQEQSRLEQVASWTQAGVSANKSKSIELSALGEPGAGFGEVIVEPLIREGMLCGALVAESEKSGDDVSKEARNLLAHAARLLAVPSHQLSAGSGSTAAPKLNPDNIKTDKKDGNIHILVVEDDEPNLNMLTKFVERFGAIPHEARDGKEAIEACERQAFDVILMDLSMPMLDGFDATREIVTGNTANRETPIVAVTADVTEGVERACKKMGMQHYISKPLRYSTIMDVLKEYISKD